VIQKTYINNEDLPSTQRSPCIDGAKPQKLKPERNRKEITIKDSM
jgi:hypothetical protein